MGGMACVSLWAGLGGQTTMPGTVTSVTFLSNMSSFCMSSLVILLLCFIILINMYMSL